MALLTVPLREGDIVRTGRYVGNVASISGDWLWIELTHYNNHKLKVPEFRTFHKLGVFRLSTKGDKL
jgi:hypothetical protein